MKNIPNDYELNEKDIDSTLNWLKIFDPKNATPQTAVEFLVYLRTVVHQEWHKDSKGLEANYEAFKLK